MEHWTIQENNEECGNQSIRLKPGLILSIRRVSASSLCCCKELGRDKK